MYSKIANYFLFYFMSCIIVMKLYGVFCGDCYGPLGIADGRINETQMVANSIFNNNKTLYGPGRARLNRTGGYRAQPGSQNSPALTVNFRKAMIVTGIATQGYYGENIQEWTKGYNLGYTFGSNTHFFKERNRITTKQFNGNDDNNTIVLHHVPLPAMLTSIHVIPTEWEINFAIRLELYGCIADGNECESIPCQNNGTCWEKIRGYQCNCTAGFNGTNCEINIDECVSNPCLNNATCSDQVNDYRCHCAPGYSGKSCETEINECFNNPCRNGGTCTDLVNGFTCRCPVKFAGSRCEKETGFFLVVWLNLKNMTFTFPLANQSSTQYQNTEKEVLDAIDNMLITEKDHFFGSALRMFSPSGTRSVTAEILLSTTRNSTNHMISVITQKLKTHVGVFDKTSKSFENRGNPSCSPPNITMSLSKDFAKPTKMKRSETFKFQVDFGVDCRVSGVIRVVYNIEMYSIYSNSGSYQRKVYRIGTTVGDLNETIIGKSFDYGLYYIKLTGSIEGKDETRVNSFGYVEVTSTALVVNITGDTQASQGINKIVTLNGSQSHDPDVGKGDYSGIIFTWLCRRDYELFPNNTASLPVVRPSSGSTKVSPDQGGCYGTGVGALESGPGAPYIVDLDIDKMKGDQGYVIVLVMTKRGLTITAAHHLRLKEEIHLQIFCVQNCQGHVILSSRLILETNCTGLLCHQLSVYTWTMKFRNTHNQDWQEVTNLDDLILTYGNSPNFVTRQGKLRGNSTYLVTVTGVTSKGHSSSATFSFVTNTPPSGGTCKVDKPEGKAWETNFVFTCTGWHDEDLPLKYKFRYNSSDGIEMVFMSGTSHEATGKLPVGDPSENYKLQVCVLVIDALGSSVDIWISVRVTEPVVTIQTLEDDVSLEGPMNQYLKDNNIEMAAQRATAVLSVVNHAQQKELRLRDKIMIKDSIVNSWSTVNVSSLQEVSQVSAVVASVADRRNEVSIDSQGKTVIMLDYMTTFMTQETGKSKHGEEELIEQTGTALLNGLGNLLDITSYEARDGNSVDEESLFVSTPARREKSKSYSTQILDLVNRVGSNVEAIKELYEKPSVLKTRTLSMVVDRQIPSRIGGKALEDESSKVVMPSIEQLVGDDGNVGQYLSSQLVTFKSNPYTWDISASDIKSVVLDFELKDENGHGINIYNLEQDVELFLSPPNQNVEQVKEYFVKPSDNGTMQFHKLEFPGAEYAISIRIVPIGNETLKLYLRYAQRPTLTNYSFTATVPDYGSCNYSVEKGYTNCTSDIFTVTVSSATTGHTGPHYLGVANERLSNQGKSNSSSGFQMKRVRRDCSHNGRQKRSCVGVKDPPTTLPPVLVITQPYNASTDVNYTLQVSMATCQYWNVTAQAWTTEGCKVGPDSRPRALQCLCNHLSSFGGNFLVAPNPIDFDYVFKQFPNIFDSGNVVVLATVLSIFGLWFIGLLIARRADAKDAYKAVESLRLQMEGGRMFELSVYTGIWRGSGTSANVAMIIYGEETRSETLHLFDRYSDKKLFARASINNFLISLPDNLLSPIMIKIWHDNSGNNPSWYISQVVIRDLESEEKWYFLCNRWLAVDKEDGEVEADIPLASERDLSKFKYKFFTRASKSLSDSHLWLSVVTRPPHSPFTRAQRLSCCVCVLVTAMLAGAMFYQFGEKQEDTHKFGPLRFSLNQLVIGVQSALIVVPLNLLIATIFRNIKISNDKERKSCYAQNEGSGLSATNLNKRPGCLPHFFVYIAWSLCILSSLAAGTFIIFYSVQWGKEIANQWLTSALISVIQDIAVMQPIKVIALALFLALILKKPPEEKTAQSFHDSTLSDDQSIKVIAPKGNELTTARKTRESVVETVSTLAEIVMFLVFVICLFLVVYGNRGYSRYRLTASLENVFKESFEEVDSTDAFWGWIEESFIPGIYDTTWYNDQSFVAPEGFLSTREAFLVGMPRFKQTRIKEVKACKTTKVYSEVEAIFGRCIPRYSPHNEDDTRFNLPGWVPVTNISKYHSVYELLRLCPKPWRYNTSVELDTLSYSGKHAKYEGGGYIADLGYNSRTASRVVRNLESNDWIDEKTAAVLIEFTVFQPSTSLFSVAKLLYEVIPTGKPETRARFHTLSIYGTSDPRLRSLFVACQIILLILVAYFLILEAVKIYRQGCSYFVSFWNWMNLLQLVSAIITIAFFFFKEKYISSFVKRVQSNPFETVSVDYALFWSDLELLVLSVVVFVVTVKFLRLIRFNRHVCQMVASLKISLPNVASYSVLFFINLISFALLGYLAFGNDNIWYHSFIDALGTLIQKFLGDELYFYELQYSNRILGPTYIFSFMLSMTFILINMFLAILNDSYESVRELSGGKFADAELGDFIKEYYLTRIHRLHEILKRKLGNVGFRHKLYDRSRNESKSQIQGDSVGSFTSLPSDYPAIVETWDPVNSSSSKLALLENEKTAKCVISTEAIYVNEVAIEGDQPDFQSKPPSVESDDGSNEELLDLLGDLPEALLAPTIASQKTLSNEDFIDLLGNLPESMVDDDETIDNVRKGLADVGAVVRLNKNTLRRFSTTGDKYIVQTNVQMMGPSVALTLRPRLESKPVVIPK